MDKTLLKHGQPKTKQSKGRVTYEGFLFNDYGRDSDRMSTRNYVLLL